MVPTSPRRRDAGISELCRSPCCKCLFDEVQWYIRLSESRRQCVQVRRTKPRSRSTYLGDDQRRWRHPTHIRSSVTEICALYAKSISSERTASLARRGPRRVESNVAIGSVRLMVFADWLTDVHVRLKPPSFNYIEAGVTAGALPRLNDARVLGDRTERCLVEPVLHRYCQYTGWSKTVSPFT